MTATDPTVEQLLGLADKATDRPLTGDEHARLRAGIGQQAAAAEQAELDAEQQDRHFRTVCGERESYRQAWKHEQKQRAVAEAALARVRATLDRWVRNCLMPGQPRRILDDVRAVLDEQTAHHPRIGSHTYEGDGGPCTTTYYGQTCHGARADHELDDGETGPAPGQAAEVCCVCGGGQVAYHNCNEQPFCWPCADCPCGQDQCARTGINAPADADPHGLKAGTIVKAYTEYGQQKWVFRCWGTDTCDGFLSLDHSSESSAQAAMNRHLGEHPELRGTAR